MIGKHLKRKIQHKITQNSSKNQNSGRKSKQLNLLRYESYQTIRVYRQNRNYFEQSDLNFVEDVRAIVMAKMEKQSMQHSFSNFLKNRLTDEQCDKLDYCARLHYRANIINQSSKYDIQKAEEQYRCQCGCNRARGNYFPICVNEQNLNILGSGVLLLFLFMKATAAILVFMVAIYGIFSLVTNLMGDWSIQAQACNANQYCQFKAFASDQNKNSNYFRFVQQWLGVALCALWILVVRSLKLVGEQKDQIIDFKSKTASDYAIIIENLPRNSYEQKQLIGYFEGLENKMIDHIEKDQSLDKNQKKQLLKIFDSDDNINKFKMKSIQVVYNMQFCRQIIESIYHLCFNLNSLLFKARDDSKTTLISNIEQYKQNKNKLKQTYELLLDLRKRFLNDPQFRKKLSTDCTVIEFKSQKMAKAVVGYFGEEKIGLFKKLQAAIKICLNMKDKNLLFKGRKLRIQRAPEPTDILWQNCQQTFSLKRQIGIYLASLLIIFISFVIMTAINYGQAAIEKQVDQSNAIWNTVLNWANSILMLITNKIMWEALFKLLDLQYNHTLTLKVVSQMNKALAFNILQTIILPIISNIVVSMLIQGTMSASIFGENGLAGLAFDYHLSTVVVTVFIIADPIMLLKKICITVKCLRKQVIKYFATNPELIDFDKGGSPQLNQFYEGEELDLAQNYVELLTAILHAAFYCYLQPIILFFVPIMIGIYYFLSRIKLTRFCKIPQLTQFLIFDTAISMLGLVPIIFGLGNIVISFLENVQNEQYQFIYVGPAICIIIGVLALLNPLGFTGRIVKFVLTKMSCIDIKQMMGAYDESDADNDDQITDEDTSHSSLDAKSKQLNERNKNNNTKKGASRIDSYFDESNSLSLFGFEGQFMSQDMGDQVTNELQKFCQAFFTKQQLKDDSQPQVKNQQNTQFQQTQTNIFFKNENINQIIEPQQVSPYAKY